MESYQKQLISLLSMSLFNIPSDVTMTDEIFKESRLQAVSSLVSSTDYQVFATNIRVINAHEDLTKVLEGIPFVTMKGYASAYYYPDPYKRPMGDVDFFVAPENYNKASEALLNAGFRNLNCEHERHEEFSKDGVIFELHSEIKGIPNGLDGIKTDSSAAEQKVRSYLSDVIETSEKVQTQYGEIIIPDAFHHGLIMLLHVAGHMINDGGVGLRHLCDWAVYVNKIDIGTFSNMLKDMGLWTFACQLTAVCEKYLGLKKNDWTGTWDEEFIDCLFEDIVDGGNFGRKGLYRRALNEVSGDSGFVASIFKLTNKKYPVTKKYPILLPGATAFWIANYGVRCLTKKCKLIKQIDWHKSKERIDLYKKFKLFEI